MITAVLIIMSKYLKLIKQIIDNLFMFKLKSTSLIFYF